MGLTIGHFTGELKDLSGASRKATASKNKSFALQPRLAHAPEGVRLNLDFGGGGYHALMVEPGSQVVQRAVRVLTKAFAHEPVFIWAGGSIPIVVSMVEALGAEPLLVGFALPEDGMHSPNESFSLVQARDNFVYACMMLEELSGGK